MTKAWALTEAKGTIVISTVSPTAVAAMVNALVAVYHVKVTRPMTDTDIAAMFQRARGDDRIIRVRVAPL